MKPNNSQKRQHRDFGVDAEIDHHLVEVKIGVAALRSIRLGIMQLAYAMIDRPDSKGFLVLPDVAVTRKRLQREWHLASLVLRPDVRDRLSICIWEGDRIIGIPRNPGTESQRILAEVVAEQRPRSGLHVTRPDYWFVVFQILIRQWLLGRGPMTTSWLMTTAGCSYPTVATVLKRLGHNLIRHPDRRIELRNFPREEWARLVAIADKARGTIHFADRSGQPRSPESLLRRLQRLDRADVAVGGVWGAKHYHPALDIVGNPRLDLSLHSPGQPMDLSFVERLDPALKRTENNNSAPSALVVHLVRRTESLFEQGEDGLQWADPVECLLDLHEARLEPQAREFLGSFRAARGKL